MGLAPVNQSTVHFIHYVYIYDRLEQAKAAAAADKLILSNSNQAARMATQAGFSKAGCVLSMLKLGEFATADLGSLFDVLNRTPSGKDLKSHSLKSAETKLCVRSLLGKSTSILD